MYNTSIIVYLTVSVKASHWTGSLLLARLAVQGSVCSFCLWLPMLRLQAWAWLLYQCWDLNPRSHACLVKAEQKQYLHKFYSCFLCYPPVQSDNVAPRCGSGWRSPHWLCFSPSCHPNSSQEMLSESWGYSLGLSWKSPAISSLACGSMGKLWDPEQRKLSKRERSWWVLLVSSDPTGLISGA